MSQQTDNPLREAIAGAISENDVILFMKGTPEQPMCGFSARSVAALEALGAPFAAVDVLPDPRIRQELSALSNWPTIPQLFARGELIGGCDIITEMYESGELAGALGVEAPADLPAEAPAGETRRGRAAAAADREPPELGAERRRSANEDRQARPARDAQQRVAEDAARALREALGAAGQVLRHRRPERQDARRHAVVAVQAGDRAGEPAIVAGPGGVSPELGSNSDERSIVAESPPDSPCVASGSVPSQDDVARARAACRRGSGRGSCARPSRRPAGAASRGR